MNWLNKLNQQQKMILYFIVFFGLIYVLYSMSFSEPMENIKVSYAALTIPGKNSLNEHIVTGEITRYIYSNGETSYDIYGYFPIINGGVFQKRVDAKYEVTLMDNDGKVLFTKDLKLDGDNVYKLKLRKEKFKNSENYNIVRVTLKSKDSSSIVVDGLLRNL
jgi:hypothetical protein